MDDLANQKLNEAEKIKSEYTERLLSAEAEIEKMKAEAEKNAESLADKRLKMAKLEAESIIKTARNAADNEKKKIIDSAQKDIAEIIIAAAKRLSAHHLIFIMTFLKMQKKIALPINKYKNSVFIITSTKTLHNRLLAFFRI